MNVTESEHGIGSTTEMDNKNYTIRQTANILGIKVRTVREWLNNGKLEGKKDNKSGRWQVSEESIMKHSVRKNDNKD